MRLELILTRDGGGSMMFDLVVKSGEIIDGTGKQSFRADIGIKDGRIEAIAPLGDQDNCPTLDVHGLVVCPGFIDIHSHSDFTLFVNRKGESKIRQGVTTEVVGNCGFTAAPVQREHFQDLLEYLANTVILSDEDKEKWKWPSQAEFLRDIEEEGFSFNIAPLVGHGTIRVASMGFDKTRPTPERMDSMLRLIETEMDSGLFGLSTGLQYEPCLYAETDELIELTRLVKKYDGVYAVHLESESKGLLQCMSEAIEVAQRSGVSLQISHLKTAFRPNWGKADVALNKIDEARKSGVDIDFDVYPYTAYGSGLIDLIPPWAREKGAGKMVEMLKDRPVQLRILKEMEESSEDWENPGHGCGWGHIRIAMVKTAENRKYEGMTVQQVADEMGCTPAEATIRLMIEEEAAIKAIYFAMCEEDLETIMRHPRAVFCTDGRAVAPYGPLGRGSVHPRYYGTYPRILGRYVRDKKIIPLEEAVMKMTYLPARKIGLRKRGLLREGYQADITVFDKNYVMDNATFDEPHRYSRGIEYVIVNGQVVIDKGQHTDALPGRVLRKGE
jgi:N-acyl-D-amino-acid deacylase